MLLVTIGLIKKQNSRLASACGVFLIGSPGIAWTIGSHGKRSYREQHPPKFFEQKKHYTSFEKTKKLQLKI